MFSLTVAEAILELVQLVVDGGRGALRAVGRRMFDLGQAGGFERLYRESDAFGFGVSGQNFDFDNLADFDDLGGSFTKLLDSSLT